MEARNISLLSGLLTQTGIFAIRIIGRMPRCIRYTIGYILGTLIYLLSGYHRHIARVNLSLCFPDMKKMNKEIFIYKSFRQLSIGVCETAYAWCGNLEKNPARVHWQGREELQKSLDEQRKILLISGHFSHLDPGIILFSRCFPVAATYKMHSNPLFNAFASRQRLKYVRQLISSKDTLAIRKALRSESILWFSIDQDIGERHSLYAPFFAALPCCHTAAWRWSRIADAEVFLLHSVREKKGGCRIMLFHLKDFAKMSAYQAISRQNEILAKAIQQAPTQYLWLHKRFKTQPESQNLYARN